MGCREILSGRLAIRLQRYSLPCTSLWLSCLERLTTLSTSRSPIGSIESWRLRRRSISRRAKSSNRSSSKRAANRERSKCAASAASSNSNWRISRKSLQSTKNAARSPKQNKPSKETTCMKRLKKMRMMRRIRAWTNYSLRSLSWSTRPEPQHPTTKHRLHLMS